jgi:hypothetical protein
MYVMNMRKTENFNKNLIYFRIQIYKFEFKKYLKCNKWNKLVFTPLKRFKNLLE